MKFYQYLYLYNTKNGSTIDQRVYRLPNKIKTCLNTGMQERIRFCIMVECEFFLGSGISSLQAC